MYLIIFYSLCYHHTIYITADFGPSNVSIIRFASHYFDRINSALLVSPRYKYKVPVSIFMTSTFSFFSLGMVVAWIGLLGLVVGGSSGNRVSPPLALVDLVLIMLPARFAAFFLTTFFFAATAEADRLPFWLDTLRDLWLSMFVTLFDSSLLRFLLDSEEEPPDPVPVTEPRVTLLAVDAGASSWLSSLWLDAVPLDDNRARLRLDLGAVSFWINRSIDFSGTSSCLRFPAGTTTQNGDASDPLGDFRTILPWVIDPLILNWHEHMEFIWGLVLYDTHRGHDDTTIKSAKSNW